MEAQVFGVALDDLVKQAIAQNLIRELGEDEGLPMIKFLDYERWVFENDQQVAIALSALIKGAEIQCLLDSRS